MRGRASADPSLGHESSSRGGTKACVCSGRAMSELASRVEDTVCSNSADNKSPAVRAGDLTRPLAAASPSTSSTHHIMSAGMDPLSALTPAIPTIPVIKHDGKSALSPKP